MKKILISLVCALGLVACGDDESHIFGKGMWDAQAIVVKTSDPFYYDGQKMDLTWYLKHDGDQKYKLYIGGYYEGEKPMTGYDNGKDTGLFTYQEVMGEGPCLDYIDIWLELRKTEDGFVGSAYQSYLFCTSSDAQGNPTSWADWATKLTVTGKPQ
jgi:hypothetical protein